ncbi:hypothetical protein L6279_03605 [Candidatus Parcubacteria bacterium]|nr:hypothetical protein [Patescibacteria group bacterium]MCG2693165.1 hypothetical protein [Candidatus Parcubacteria bacterium]
MTLQEVYKKAIKMEIGERETFVLDEMPAKGQIAILCFELTRDAGAKKSFIANRSDKNLHISCYKPLKN